MDCSSSSIESGDANFAQLSTLVMSAREYLDSFRAKQNAERDHSFEISERLTIPLENIDKLSTALFEAAHDQVNEEQKSYLLVCKRVLARFYCYIEHVIKLYSARSMADLTIGTQEYAKKILNEFYLNAAYELRTPYFLLVGYSQQHVLDSEPQGLKELIARIQSSPFVPENQDKVNEIRYWVAELGKFIDDLPRLWREVGKENAA